ncbi:hypothetical protein Rhopal_005875-T1 [Rhodotorula paludigena]|uniref:F-box domain-containing protein n=1 Tax=Rhodotorula paludigena TaxID=86838 RepID=A0AAV5GTK8_9BASI|nr:hypothetical protein Rhopal_005875-T1 [Rhodotorula paludigena]
MSEADSDNASFHSSSHEGRDSSSGSRSASPASDPARRGGRSYAWVLATLPKPTELPIEIWWMVLDHLDYRGLHKAQLLCKQVQTLIQDERFDAILFREPPSKGKLPSNMQVAIHPLLQSVSCIFTGSDAITWADMAKDNWTRTAFEYPAVDEFATSPSCDIVNLHVNTAKTVPVTDRNGVKVRRVLQRLGKHWSSKPTRFVAEQLAAQEGVDPDKTTWLLALGDHNGWAGWKEAFTENEGMAVELHASWFDS